MKKYLVLFLLTSSCTSFIIDPRGSKEPREIIRDKMECKEIIRQEASIVDRLLLKKLMFKQCLQNRGHSILN